MNSSVKKVVMIGSGNVAWSLAQNIDRHPHYSVTQVYSRNLDRSKELCALLADAQAINNISDTAADADIYIISVKDDAIANIVKALPRSEALWLHTSGGVEASVLSSVSRKHGVLYPLQTFTRGRLLDLSAVPFFIEGSTPESLDEIKNLAGDVSKRVIVADSMRRKKMHVAAVFACNFTNYLWTIAEELLEKNGMEFDVLEPLVKETMNKAFEISPSKGQTGPARRGDKRVIDSHLETLDGDYALLYRMLTDKIMKRYEQD